MVSIEDIPAEVRWEIAAKAASATPLAYDMIFREVLGDKYDEIELPHITRTLAKTAWQIPYHLLKHEHTTLTAVTGRIGASESTVSRQSAKLAGLHTVEITPAGRKKQIASTLSGKVLLKCATFLTDARSND